MQNFFIYYIISNVFLILVSIVSIFCFFRKKALCSTLCEQIDKQDENLKELNELQITNKILLQERENRISEKTEKLVEYEKCKVIY